MGIFRWTGRQMAKPITLRAGAYRDIGHGLKSVRRAAMRSTPGLKRNSPPILSNISSSNIDKLYDRWSTFTPDQRSAAWREYSDAMPLLMQLTASESGRDWSLAVPGDRRSLRYLEIQKSLKTSLMIYGAMLLVPSLFIISYGNTAIYWMNLLALAFLLAPNPLRLLILRAQLYHGGRVSPQQLFKRYPNALPASEHEEHGEQGNEESPSTQEDQQQTLAQRFPMLSVLYGITEESPLTGGSA